MKQLGVFSSFPLHILIFHWKWSKTYGSRWGWNMKVFTKEFRYQRREKNRFQFKFWKIFLGFKIYRQLCIFRFLKENSSNNLAVSIVSKYLLYKQLFSSFHVSSDMPTNFSVLLAECIFKVREIREITAIKNYNQLSCLQLYKPALDYSF